MRMNEIQKIYNRLRHNQEADWVIQTDEKTVIRRFIPHQRLILLGGGHIASALCHFADRLDFDVTVVDDRPDFANAQRFPDASQIICDGFVSAIRKLEISEYDYVAVLTRGHRWDKECLLQLSKGIQPYYVGQVGSRRRVQELFRLLREEEGVSPAFLEQVCTPIGLDIGAQTPQEIAVAILAELIQKRSRRPKEEQFLVQTNYEEAIFQDLLSGTDLTEPGRRVIAVIVDTKGSVPARTGAVMCCNLLGRTAGTVGGGCGENAVITEAREVLQSGKPKLVAVDMTGDISEDDGMVCGGTMKVWLEPVI